MKNFALIPDDAGVAVDVSDGSRYRVTAQSVDML